MADESRPTVGDWYETMSGATFEVVALDEEEGTVEIQYFDGTLEELDTESWHELEVNAIEPPEDWSGPMDIDREDLGSERSQPNLDWNLLDDLDRD